MGCRTVSGKHGFIFASVLLSAWIYISLQKPISPSQNRTRQCVNCNVVILFSTRWGIINILFLPKTVLHSAPYVTETLPSNRNKMQNVSALSKLQTSPLANLYLTKPLLPGGGSSYKTNVRGNKVVSYGGIFNYYPYKRRCYLFP